jgi:hypothetical protein
MGDDGSMGADVGTPPADAGDDSVSSGTGQFTATFDASMPNHFGAEHNGTTAYGALFDTTGATRMQVGSLYSTPLNAMGYCKWVWPNALVAGHKYTIAIFADAAAMNPTCKASDAGWLFQLPQMGGTVTGDSVFTFPTGHAPRADATKCSYFPMGPIMGAVSVPPP